MALNQDHQNTAPSQYYTGREFCTSHLYITVFKCSTLKEGGRKRLVIVTLGLSTIS